jgi:hypothetical protein
MDRKTYLVFQVHLGQKTGTTRTLRRKAAATSIRTCYFALHDTSVGFTP